MPSRTPWMLARVHRASHGSSARGTAARRRTRGGQRRERRRPGAPPVPDRDRDSVADAADACPDHPGQAHEDATQNGCPRPAPAATLEESTIAITEQVQFETGTAQLRSESEAILGEVSSVLKRHPELAVVEVAGHTDDTGGEASNERLSRE